MLPLYEAKMIHHYDHRWATYEEDGSTRDGTRQEKQNPEFVVQPRYWVREEVVQDRLGGRAGQDWILGFRDICRSTDERTMIASQLPTTAVGHTLPVAFTQQGQAVLQAAWSSFVFDYVARQKVGGTHMTYSYLMQLPFPLPQSNSDNAIQAEWISERAEHLQRSDAWVGVDRDSIRAELDAAFFHLYGIERNDVDYIMETFPIVKRKDIAEHGEYRTKRMILEIYDAMAEAEKCGVPYRSPFDEVDGK
ncbi:MAG: hypothetical protein FGM52_03590 [Mycobacterium sp.]|nr:hypothetical protein [Mycobacterium sp.]